jgi:hypothetical protein
MPAGEGRAGLISLEADIDLETGRFQQLQVAQHTVSRARDTFVADREDPQPPHARGRGSPTVVGGNACDHRPTRLNRSAFQIKLR